MQTIIVDGSTGRSQILIGETLSNLGSYLPAGRTIVISDARVAALYGDRFPSGERILIGEGEAIKTLETVSRIYQQLIQLEADRGTFIVGIGGGIVGDIAGFAASTFMRGLRFGFVATTLLAQVDASVGGKNGVNFHGYKNMVGVFNQPEFVIADLDLLKTLPAAELAGGLAEIVKHACIADAAYFDYIEAHGAAVERLDPEVMLHLVAESVRIKAGVVNRDERENGERRILNFGHTFGHAYEKTLRLSHGAAVALGMVTAAELSREEGLLAPVEVQRIAALLKRLKLPVHAEVDCQAVFDALRRDKKRLREQLHMVLLDRIGHCVVQPIAMLDLERWFGQFRFPSMA
jgi:3-dehydroquinate synthase